MSVVTSLRLENTVRKRVQARARANRRSFSEQMKYYVFLGMVAEENPDLPLMFIKDLLEAKEEAKAGLIVPYRWGVLK
jgi:hypothetical protein